MSDEQVLRILNNFSNVFNENDVFSQALRGLGWMLINLLKSVSNKLEEVNDKVYSMIDFFNYKEVAEILDKFKPVIWIILLISIMYLAYQFVINRRYQADNIFMNIIMSIMVIMLIPSLMGQVGKITTNGIKAVNNEYTSTANEIIKGNVVDLYYLDKDNFSSKDAKNRISEDKIDKIDINETIETNETENKDVFENKIKTDESGNQKITKLGKSFGFIQSKYFRYHFDFLPILISIGCITIAQLFVALKVAKLIFELGFGKLFAMFYAFADIASGQRIKNIVQHVFTIFAVIFSTSLSLKLYTIYTKWVSTVADTNMVVQMIFLVAGAWAVIDGPDIVERALGIDAGVKSSGGVIAAGISGGKIAGDMINGAKGILTSGISNAAKAITEGDKMESDFIQDSINQNESKDGQVDYDDNIDLNNSSVMDDKGGEGSEQDSTDDLVCIDENKFESEPIDLESGEINLDEIKKNINDDLDVSDTNIPNADVANADITNAHIPENQITQSSLTSDDLDRNNNVDDINSLSNISPSISDENDLNLETQAPLQDRIEFGNISGLDADNLEYGLSDEFKNHDNDISLINRENITPSREKNSQSNANSITNNFNSIKNNTLNTSDKNKKSTDVNIRNEDHN